MSKENGKTCRTCKHWGELISALGIPVKAAVCTAVLFPTVIKTVIGEGAHQIPGGTQLITLEDSFCTFFYQPKLQAIRNWGGKRPLLVEAPRSKMAELDDTPKESA